MSVERSQIPLLIAFVDLTLFAKESQRRDDNELAETLDLYYQRVAETMERAGGRVVKFIGDGVLIVFPESGVDRGVQALLDLKKTIDAVMETRGWSSRLVVKVHFGPVIAGPFGPARAFDVIGKNVNAAAMLSSSGVTLSADAFHRLSGELRQRFREHAPLATYIRAEDEPPFRR